MKRRRSTGSKPQAKRQRRASNALQVAKHVAGGVAAAYKGNYWTAVKSAYGAYKQVKQHSAKSNQWEKPLIESTAFPEKVVKVSNIKKPKKMARTMKLLGNKALYDSVTTGGGISLKSVQSVAVWADYYTQSDIASLYETAATQYNHITSTEIALDASHTAYNGMKFLVSGCRSELRLVNQAPSPMEMDIYVLISKVTKTTAVTPIVDWQSDIDSVKGANTLTQTIPYNTPLDGVIFKRNWSVVKKYRVSMGPGCLHLVKYNHRPNRVIDIAYATANAQLAGLTSHIMVVQRGTLADDSNATTVGLIGLSQTKMIGVLKRRYESRLVGFWPRTHYSSNNISSAMTVLYQQDEDEEVENVLAVAGFA